jgi:hypothetical protein
VAEETEDKAAPVTGAAKVEGVKVNFGVSIPELGKTYTKDELETDQEAIDYLIEIKSKAVTVLSK